MLGICGDGLDYQICKPYFSFCMLAWDNRVTWKQTGESLGALAWQYSLMGGHEGWGEILSQK